MSAIEFPPQASRAGVPLPATGTAAAGKDRARPLLRDPVFADEMRRLRMSIVSASSPIKSLMIIGASGGEGVSSVAHALASLFVEEDGAKVALLDARPRSGDAKPLITRVAELVAGGVLVIVDAPPIARDSLGLTIAPHVDGVLLVVECDRTPLDTLSFAKEKLDAAGAHVVGSVLNRSGRYLAGAWWRRLRRRFAARG